MTLEAIVRTENGRGLRILDQLLLPDQSVYIDVDNVEDAWAAIREMKARRHIHRRTRIYKMGLL